MTPIKKRIYASALLLAAILVFNVFAYFNIEKLGVIVKRYYVNLYGATTSALQAGLDSDRVVAEWWIDRLRIPIEGDIRRLDIPTDIQALKRQSLKSAQDVQMRVREQFLKNIQDDYFVAGFERQELRLLRPERCAHGRIECTHDHHLAVASIAGRHCPHH